MSGKETDAELAAPITDGLSGNIKAAAYFSNHAVALTLVTVCLALRIYVRKSIVKALGVDDYLLIAAYIVFLGQFILMFIYGARLVIDGLAPQYFNSLLIISFWGFLYVIILVLVRMAIAAFFLRVLPAPAFNWQRYTIIASVGIYSVFSMIYNFIQLYQCGNPLDVRNPNPTCLNIEALNALALASTIFNMIIDWILTLLPATVIYKSSMSRRNKIQVIAVLSMGAVGSIISIVRIPYLNLGIFEGPDQFANLSVYFILALWENTAAMAAISVAALKPLATRYFPSIYNLGASDDPLTESTPPNCADRRSDSQQRQKSLEKDDLTAAVFEVVTTEDVHGRCLRQDVRTIS